jgi:cbb3-type cytochrome oxidase subunit 3
MKFCLFLFILATLSSQEIDFVAYVEDKNLHDQKTFDLILEFKWQGKPQDYQINLPNSLDLIGLEALGSGASNKLLSENSISIAKRVVKYKLRALRAGSVEISNIKATATHTETGQVTNLESLAIRLEIKKYEKPFELESKFIWLIIISILFLAVIVFLVFFLSKRRKKNLEAFQSDIIITIEDEILSKIKRIKNDVLSVSDEFLGFINLFEQYVKDEIIEKNGIFFGDSDVHFSLSDFKNKLEMYRFSGQNPDIYEFDELIKQFCFILENNKQHRKELEIKEQ